MNGWEGRSYSVEAYPKGDLRNSIYDGIFANMFATLTGGVFLTGFALFLGMSEFMIGLLASMPFLVTIFQLPTSYFLMKYGNRKKIALGAAAIARLIWIPILTTAFIPNLSTSAKALVILGLLFISYAFISISYVSWLSWISDLVPDSIRGSFFATRNMLCGAAGMVVMVVSGKLLDVLNGQSYKGLPLGFAFAFTLAVFFGMLSLRFINRISEPQREQVEKTRSFGESIGLPLKEPRFRSFLIFAFLWSFSVHIASPFFTLYFLRELRFSYGFVAALGVLSALADMLGMRFWGKISDRVRNKAVIRLAGWIAVFLPLLWVTVRPESVIMPVLLHLLGGGFWAGINLCMNNLLLRISPQDYRAWYFSTYNILGGLGAAIAPVLAGLFLKLLGDLDFQIFSWNLVPLHLIFIISTLFRLLSIQILKYVREPEEAPVGQIVRVLRSARGLSMTNGFNYLLHPFIEILENKHES